MEALERQLSILEENVGRIDSDTAFHAQLAQIRSKLESLKMDFVLKAPLPDLKKIVKRQEPEDCLSLEEKLFVIEMSKDFVVSHVQQLVEMEKLAEIVFESEHLKKLPGATALDGCRQLVNELNLEYVKSRHQFADFVKQQSDDINSLKDSSVTCT